MPRVVLILPSGTYRAEDFLAAAAGLGMDVVVASDHRQAMSTAMGERALVVDLCDPGGAADAICALSARHPVDAVLAVDDEGVVTAALAAARLGLPHNDPGAVAATRDKTRLRSALAAHGVHQPAYRVAGPDDDVGSAAAELGFPVVVKPAALSASRGVIRADDPGAARAAADRIRRIVASAGGDPAGPLLVERFVAGPEVAVEAMLTDGAVELLAVFDKPDPLDGPFFEETIYVTPSRLDPAALESVTGELRAGLAAIGLRQGVVHAEMRVPDGRAHVIEIAARSIGGLCSRALRFVTDTPGDGTSLEQLILANAVGIPVGAGSHREMAAAGVMMIPIRASGRLARVDGQDAARQVPLVTDVRITIPPGGRVVPLPEGDRYLGFIFSRGPEPERVEAALRQALDCLEIVISP